MCLPNPIVSTTSPPPERKCPGNCRGCKHRNQPEPCPGVAAILEAMKRRQVSVGQGAVPVGRG